MGTYSYKVVSPSDVSWFIIPINYTYIYHKLYNSATFLSGNLAILGAPIPSGSSNCYHWISLHRHQLHGGSSHGDLDHITSQ